MTKLEQNVAPSIFIGHGNPMNALFDNDFTKHLTLLGNSLINIKGILVISAHWITSGTQITSHKNNPLVYDFYGFPDELFQVRFESVGSPEIANKISEQLNSDSIVTTDQWGLDHGAWTVLKHMFPNKPHFPIFQISLNKDWTLSQHFEFAKSLEQFRKQGFVILGSGNIVHNLRQISWQEPSPTPDWAIEFDQLVAQALNDRNFDALINPAPEKVSLWKQAHPTIDHYLPLLYSVAASNKTDSLSYPYIGFQNGSLSMRSVAFR